MKEINGYYTSYSDSNNNLAFLKYGLLNEYGPSFKENKSYYNEDDIIKHKCHKRINNLKK